MMKQLGDASEVTDTTAQPVSSSSKSPPSTTNPDDKFQATIKKTMERMQASGEKATAAAAEDDSEDFLAEMLKQMQAGALGGEGSEEDFSKMLMGMMEQLTNKEILYEPMKELDDKFPNWLEKNREKTGKEDLERFLEQQRLVREIVARFEERGYSDEDVKSREYIVDRMQKVCRFFSSFLTARFHSSRGVSYLLILRYILTNHRCKQQDLHQQIWWEAWRQLKRPLVVVMVLKMDVQLNENNNAVCTLYKKNENMRSIACDYMEVKNGNGR